MRSQGFSLLCLSLFGTGASADTDADYLLMLFYYVKPLFSSVKKGIFGTNGHAMY
jgi:hypothetical protein